MKKFLLFTVFVTLFVFSTATFDEDETQALFSTASFEQDVEDFLDYATTLGLTEDEAIALMYRVITKGVEFMKKNPIAVGVATNIISSPITKKTDKAFEYLGDKVKEMGRKIKKDLENMEYPDPSQPEFWDSS